MGLRRAASLALALRCPLLHPLFELQPTPYPLDRPEAARVCAVCCGPMINGQVHDKYWTVFGVSKMTVLIPKLPVCVAEGCAGVSWVTITTPNDKRCTQGGGGVKIRWFVRRRERGGRGRREWAAWHSVDKGVQSRGPRFLPLHADVLGRHECVEWLLRYLDGDAELESCNADAPHRVHSHGPRRINSNSSNVAAVPARSHIMPRPSQSSTY